MGYVIDNTDFKSNPDIAIGVTFPFSGQAIFNSSYTTMDQAISNLKNLFTKLIIEIPLFLCFLREYSEIYEI